MDYVDALEGEDVDYGLVDLYADVWKYARRYWRMFFGAVFLSLASEAVWLYPAWALGEMTTFFAAYKPGEPLDYFFLILGLWLIAGAFRFTSRELCKFWGFQVAERMALDARVDAIRHLFKLDIVWHEAEYAGSKMRRIGNGSEALNVIVRMLYSNVIASTVSIVGITFILGSLDTELSAGLILFIVTYYLLSFWMTRKASAQSRLVSRMEEAADGVSFESIVNVATIKTMGLEAQILARISAAVERLMAEIRTRIAYFRRREAVLTNYALVFRLGSMAYIGWGIYLGKFEVGVLVMFYAYFDRIWNATAEMASTTNDLLVKMVSLGRLKAMMDVEPTIDVSGKKLMRGDWRSIRLSNVSFSYGGRQVLENINLTIRRGERVGLVGQSGSGKTTLFKLLLKLHESYTGEILVDDVPLRDIDRASYIALISVVLQETEVFNLSLRENIELAGGVGGSLEKAVKTANLEEVVARLPHGADTVIGEKGIRLSGGEKQRLGIARAVYRNPDIIFLDEATSHLDTHSETKIKESLRNVFKDVTAIVIAHRLSTIREMDRIVVLEGGRIAEEGSFEELLTGKGVFYDLWQKQKL